MILSLRSVNHFFVCTNVIPSSYYQGLEEDLNVHSFIVSTECCQSSVVPFLGAFGIFHTPFSNKKYSRPSKARQSIVVPLFHPSATAGIFNSLHCTFIIYYEHRKSMVPKSLTTN